MNEQEWLSATNPQPMLTFVRGKVSPRKLRLFAVACFRRVWHLLTPAYGQQVVEVAERYAEGEATYDDLLGAPYGYGYRAADRFAAALRCDDESLPRDVHEIAIQVAAVAAATYGGHAEERFMQAELLRDVCGNPFRPVRFDPFWLSWNGGIVAHLARQVHGERRFVDMPVLGEALEDAGCTEESILAHCRHPGEHVRGCWVLDLLLGGGYYGVGGRACSSSCWRC